MRKAMKLQEAISRAQDTPPFPQAVKKCWKCQVRTTHTFEKRAGCVIAKCYVCASEFAYNLPKPSFK